MTPRRAAIGAIGLATVLVAGALQLGAQTTPAPPHPDLTRYLPLEVGTSSRIRVAWSYGGGIAVEMVRRVEGQDELDDGQLYARIDSRLASRQQRRPWSVEWLRAEGDQVLCAARQIGRDVFEIVPPQPILVAPLEAGRAWTWEGRVGDLECRAAFRVLGLTGDEVLGEVLEVEQVTDAGGDLQSTRIMRFAPGLGLIGEVGEFPVGQLNLPVDGVKAVYVPPENAIR